MSLSEALFVSLPLWEQLTRQGSELQRLLAQEDKRGEENLLSQGLHCGYAQNCHGSSYDWVWDQNGKDKLALLAERLPSRVDEYDAGGMSPLMRAIQSGNLDVIRALLARVPLDVDIDKPLEQNPSVRPRNM